MAKSLFARTLHGKALANRELALAYRQLNPIHGFKWRVLTLVAAGLALMMPPSARAGGGPLGIDSVWTLDQSGIWARKYQTALATAVIATEIGGALWLGNEDKLGHTFWQTIDASVVSGVTAQLLKLTFSRARPSQGGDPNKWFQGRCCESFPSGEVTLQASFVTPLIVNYAKESPWIWSLALLPTYDAIARLKSQAHWQTDVIAGAMLGAGVGYWTTTREVPLSVKFLPHGISVGYSKRF
jgi:membrane-associated phospholipid phosphatase